MSRLSRMASSPEAGRLTTSRRDAFAPARLLALISPVRYVVLIALAMVLILVILPVVLGAAGLHAVAAG